ncbi:MAG TPA: YdcH family protein [Geminicoccaceae bacterium]|nr:YdcH family protein [Geminicoccaceae bacterium]
MAVSEYVESLRSKHAELEQVIIEESLRPLPDQALLSQLKRQKLRIKDEIARLTTHAANGATGAHGRVAAH